ncbi:MAG: hypothetical protein FWE45_01535 [Firmicutes bacterium]|nr:hypothetical protein [Bacillota bacterium]
MLKRYSIDQIIILVSAILFLAGGVFMLINVFAGQGWAFGVGLGLVVVASALVVISEVQRRKNEPKEQEPTEDLQKDKNNV